MKKSDLTFGERLQDLRKDKKLKLKDVENETGISQSSLSNYENAETPEGIGLHNLLELARFYNVSIPYLLGETEAYKPEDKELGLSNDFMTHVKINKILLKYGVVDYDIIEVLNDLFRNPIIVDDIFDAISKYLNSEKRDSIYSAMLKTGVNLLPEESGDISISNIRRALTYHYNTFYNEDCKDKEKNLKNIKESRENLDSWMKWE